MKNENSYFVQINKDLIVRYEAVSTVRWNKEEKRYEVGVYGNTYYFDKKDGEKLLSVMSIKP